MRKLLSVLVLAMILLVIASSESKSLDINQFEESLHQFMIKEDEIEKIVKSQMILCDNVRLLDIAQYNLILVYYIDSKADG